MSTTYTPRHEYVGAGNQAAYDFDFKISSEDQLTVIVSDANFVETFKVDGTDIVDLDTVVYDAVNGGGTVTLTVNLPTGHHLAIIQSSLAGIQDYEFKNKSQYTLQRIELALDNLSTQIQSLSYRAGRSLKISETILDSEDFNVELPMVTTDNLIQDYAGKLLKIAADNKSIDLSALTYQDILDLIQALQDQVDSLGAAVGSGGLPVGGGIGDAITKDSTTDGDATWKNFDYNGVGRFGATGALVGLKATIDYIMQITRQTPTVSLTMAGGSGTVREKGTVVASSLMTATVTQGDDPIVNVRFYQGASLLATQTGNPPVPNGGVDTYNYATPFSDTISFTAQTVDDGSTNGGTPSNATSNTVTWTFLYPYYWGNAAVGLAAGSVAGTLTKVVATKPSSLTFTAPGGQVFYVVIPVASGAYTSIKDTLGFETIGDWTRTTISITGLDATSQSYYKYEFNNIVIAGSYPYTFV